MGIKSYWLHRGLHPVPSSQAVERAGGEWDLVSLSVFSQRGTMLHELYEREVQGAFCTQNFLFIHMDIGREGDVEIKVEKWNHRVAGML